MKSMEIIKTLEESGKSVFSTNDIAKIVGKETSYIALLLYRLKKRKYLLEIEKNKYVILGTHPFAIASNLVYPAYISFLSALSYHKLTTQIPNTIFVVILKPKKQIIFDRYKIRFVKFQTPRFFGFKRERLGKKFVFIAEPEKAIIDSVFLPKYCSLDETYNAMKNIDYKKLIDYSLKMNSIVLLKRLGFMLELIEKNEKNVRDIYHKFKDKINKKYDLLNPYLPNKGEKNKKWKLIVNDKLYLK